MGERMASPRAIRDLAPNERDTGLPYCVPLQDTTGHASCLPSLASHSSSSSTRHVDRSQARLRRRWDEAVRLLSVHRRRALQILRAARSTRTGANRREGHGLRRALARLVLAEWTTGNNGSSGRGRERWAGAGGEGRSMSPSRRVRGRAAVTPCVGTLSRRSSPRGSLNPSLRVLYKNRNTPQQEPNAGPRGLSPDPARKDAALRSGGGDAFHRGGLR